METLNRNQNRSLNGKLKGDLNENRNGNLNGNPNGKLNGNWGKPDRNLNEPNLGPNWNQQASFGGPWKVLGDPWVVLGRSLEGPLGGSPEESIGDQAGTQGWTGTGPAPGTQKVPKAYNCCQKQAQGQTSRHRAGTDFGTP